jgi:hypothetical protein
LAADLVRKFRIRYGNYKGDHKIYATVGAFREDYPDVPLIQWPHIDMNTVQPGFWVEAEDGWITQILNIYKMPKPKNWIGETTFNSWVFRFPMTGFIVYNRKDGSVRIPHLYAAHTTSDKYGNSESRVMRSNDKQKAMWIEMVIQGIDPLEARRICFNDKRVLTYTQEINLVVRLIRDKLVKDAIMSYISKMTKVITKKVTAEDFADRILKFYDKTGEKPGTADDLKGIRLMKELLIAIDKIPSDRVDEIEDAEYIEDDIPQLN